MNPLAEFGIGLVDKLTKYFPSEEEKNKAKLEIIRAEQMGELEELKTRLSAILAEAQSTDPWTSRARPGFLYVIYILLLASLPMGIVSAVNNDVALAIALGFKAWLTAIPEPLYALFGAGYLGYAGFRSWDKKNGTV